MKKIILYTILSLTPMLSFAGEKDSTNEQTKEFNWKPQLDRVDREIDKNVFAFKDEITAGLSASYATLTTDDTNLLTVIEGLDVDGFITSVTPFVGWFYRDNRAIGMRLGYSKIKGELSSATLDLGESNGISFDVPYVALNNESYSVSFFHRSYAALDPKGRLGVFADLELNMSRGRTEFSYESSGTVCTTDSRNQGLDIKFKPGLAVYIFPNVCGTVSLGLGGLSYSETKQYNENGKLVGGRTYSNFDLKFNILDINIGVVIHFWKK